MERIYQNQFLEIFQDMTLFLFLFTIIHRNLRFGILIKFSSMSLKLSDFETVKDLGSGSFGSVKLVRKKDDSQIFAMKTVSLGRLTQKEKDNALNEVRLLASIQIPNVIAYKASFFDQESNSLCIVMEYADGGDLQGKVQELRDQQKIIGFEEKYVWKVAYEILNGLKMLHANKIIHRDIKSANIFFVNGIAKLGDLNVSKVAEQGLCETQTGTPYYTSPQIWKGKKYGNKCDIWSLGVLLYEMCTLKMPFMGRDFPSLYRKVIQGTYEDISQFYSDEMRNLIRMCLVVEEEMRPSANQLLETAILSGMEMSLSSFNAQEGQVKLIDPIKCPRVLRFLAVKLPKPRFEEEKKVTFNKTLKRENEEGSFKIKSVKKIRSQKNIQIEEPQEIVSKKLEKAGSRKVIQFDDHEQKNVIVSPKIERVVSKKNLHIEQESGKLERVGSKKNIKLPPLENETKILPSIINKEQEKKSLKHIPSSRKLIHTSTKHIQLNEKEN